MIYRDTHADKCNYTCEDFSQHFVDEVYQVPEIRNEDKDNRNPPEGQQGHITCFSREVALRTVNRRHILDKLMKVLVAGRDTTYGSTPRRCFLNVSEEPTRLGQIFVKE